MGVTLNSLMVFVIYGQLCTWRQILSQEGIDWFRIAREDLRISLRKQSNTNTAKNVILFIGEGIDPATVTASRILRGQLNGNPGEETVLAFEKFPNNALIKNYAVDLQVPESSSTSTAMFCGIKSKARIMGLRDTATFNVCSSQFGAEVPCIMEWFNQQERSVGIVTDARITDPVVASGYAKTANRLWEGDFRQTAKDIAEGCEDTAKQLILRNSFIKVIFGGGRRFFIKNTTADPEEGLKFQNQQRRDGNDLTQIWLKDKKRRRARATYVWNNKQFKRIIPERTDFALGLFSSGAMASELDRDKTATGEPSLPEMTNKAIKILQKNRKGFFLVVGCSLVDDAHHSNNAKRALFQTLQFEEAVKQSLKLTDESNTLILVTPAFAQMLKIAGFSDRGNDILGIAQPGPSRTPDGLPYTTLVYGDGPGYDFGRRRNFTAAETRSINFTQASAVPLTGSTHSGEDVPVYALGPWSHLFHSTHEQNYIAHVMAYASCVGPYSSRCIRKRTFY